MTIKLPLMMSVLASVACFAAEPAAAQMMGNGPYSFPARSNSFAAQAQITQKLNSNGGAGSGMDALSQYVYNSSSTAIGNYNSVTVGDNSSATVGSHQDSNGNQGAESTTEIKNVTNINDKAPTGHSHP